MGVMENIESDRGFISGFICVGIHMTIHHIIQHIHIANRCKKELADLKQVVRSIEVTIMHIQQNRLAFKDTASAVNGWLKELDGLLLQASKMVQRCSIPESRVIFSGFQTKKKISSLISDIKEHLEKWSPLRTRIPEGQMGGTQKVLEGLGQIKDSAEALASAATTSQAAISPRGRVLKNSREEGLDMVGRKEAFEYLEELLVDEEKKHNKIGVLGESGSGKTLLLRKLFNAQKVRNHFDGGLLLWLTVLKSQSLQSVINQLCRQIAVQTKGAVGKYMNTEWLKERVEGKKIALFIDDLVEGELLRAVDKLVSDHSNWKVIVSSRDPTALSKMGVPDDCRRKMENLKEDESLELFAHQFPNNKENRPLKIDEEKAKLFACEGFPPAIKVVGRAMASSPHPQQWTWALDRLTEAQRLDDFLRLGLDALGNEDANMQLCFLHLAAAFLEDENVEAQEVIPLWMGEGLLAMKMLQNGPAHILADRSFIEPMIRNTDGDPVCLRMQDPVEIARLYVDQLAERCLIEPLVRDTNGRVVCFRMLKVLRDLAIRIAQKEENFYCRVGDSLKESKRIFLSRNELLSLPQFASSSDICSLLISQNTKLEKIKVIGSMISLKVLDLSGTLAHSLPKGVGCLKQLICLKLSGMPIRGLPKSITGLGHLEILDVSFTKIEELPSGIHKLRSLRYLGLSGCKELQNLPYSFSALMSLQYLYMDGCSLWREPTTNRCQKVVDGCRMLIKRYRKVASMESLGDLIQLKKLALQNDLEAISEDTLKSTLGSMAGLDTLLLKLPKMESPILKMKNGESILKNLTYLKFYQCFKLKDLQNLQKLQNLKQLEIIFCPAVEHLPKEFGEGKAFPSLKIFSLVGLQNLVELPEKGKDAMPFLEIFTIMGCTNLKMLPTTYLNSRIRITVYCDPEIVENFKKVEKGKEDMVQVVRMSMSTTEIKEIIEELQIFHKREKWILGESWCNELFLLVNGYMVDSGQ